MREIIGAQAPTAPQSPPLYIRWPRPGVPHDSTLLEDVPYGLAVHWVQVPGRSHRQMRRCMRPDTCAHCAVGVGVSWACFLAAWSHVERRYVGNVYGPDTWKALLLLFPDEEPLRGGRVLATRSTEHRSSPIILSRKGMPLRPVPDAPDIRPCLRGLFGADLFPDGQARETSDEMGGCS